MGLICDYITPGGLTAVGAYHRIDTIHVDLRKAEDGVSNETTCYIYYNIEISKDKASRDVENPLVGGLSFRLEVDLTNMAANQYNIVKGGYEYLKTLSEYDGAVDE